MQSDRRAGQAGLGDIVAVGHQEPTGAGRRSSIVLVVILLLATGGVAWSQRQAMADQWARWFGPQVEATVTTTDLRPGPLARRRDASAVWTGSKLIVWGGYAGAGDYTYRNYSDGAAYDPATGRWTTIAAAPLSGREEHLAVWTGREMIVWGGVARVDRVKETATGAAYDPTTDRWRRIANAPIAGAGRPTGVMWRGKLAIAVPVDQRPASSQPNHALLLYDPATDRWQQFPVGDTPVQAAVYRDRLYVLGVPAVTGRPWLREITADGGATELPLPPLEPNPSSVGMVASQRGLAVLAGRDRTTVARWTGTGSIPTWQVRSLPDLPGPIDLFANFPGASGPLDSRHVVTTGVHGSAVVDLLTGAARRLPQDDGRFCGSGAAFAWTGTTMLAWGGEDCTDTSGPRTISRGVSLAVRVRPQ